MANLKPDIVIFQWSIAIRVYQLVGSSDNLKKMWQCEVILDLRRIIQKKSKVPSTGFFTKMGISGADTYIVHALKTFEELKTLYPARKFHLTYDGRDHRQKPLSLNCSIPFMIYTSQSNFDVEAFKQKYGLGGGRSSVFGFIRKYKGDCTKVIESFSKVAAREMMWVCWFVANLLEHPRPWKHHNADEKTDFWSG